MVEHLGLVGAAAASRDQLLAARVLGELRRVQEARLGAHRALVPRDDGEAPAGAVVPQLQRVLRPPRARQDLVPVVDVDRVAGHVRPVDAAHRVAHAQVPDLQCVVPAARHQRVVVLRQELEREDAVRVARRQRPHPAGHARDLALGGLIVHADLQADRHTTRASR